MYRSHETNILYLWKPIIALSSLGLSAAGDVAAVEEEEGSDPKELDKTGSNWFADHDKLETKTQEIKEEGGRWLLYITEPFSKKEVDINGYRYVTAGMECYWNRPLYYNCNFHAAPFTVN